MNDRKQKMHDDSRDSDPFSELLAQAWRTFDRLHSQDFVVRPAIPVLYFGDSRRYFSSRLRVITVGLNPSGNEFPDNGGFCRFPAASAMASDPLQREHSGHRRALDAYFSTDAYWKWFNSLEPILNGIDASYTGDRTNVAIHTDICSPIATSPTWSKLTRTQKSILEADGIDLWHSLVEVLAPHIIIVSIAQRYLDHIRFPHASPKRVIWKLEREQPFQVFGKWLTIKSSRSLLAFGRPAQTPFGTIAKTTKPAIGSAIKDYYHADLH